MTVRSHTRIADELPLVRVDENRWQLTRAGLLNVWQYTEEVLAAERGRLLLYGPNGSGKTMALELLLPHLLDARGQPDRLTTSGADRGGLWERVTGGREEPRTGYLWLEHRRRNGVAFTIGVRLRAKPSGGGEKHWFTTSLRVGVDFSLLDEFRRPVSVDKLAERIGPSGKVWGADTAGYRNMVRTTLFPGWSEDRLDALIRTLLVVRKQSVTDGLSSARLSQLLSEALPPLDDLELGRVADGFADLDRRGDHIEQLEEDITATRRLAEANRSYARAVVARVTGEVVAATTLFDNVTRDVRDLLKEFGDCQRRVDELKTQHEALELEERGLAGRLDGLMSSEAYRRGAELNNLRDAAAGAERRANEAQHDAKTGRKKADERARTAVEVVNQLDQARKQLASARREIEQLVERLAAPSFDGTTDETFGTFIRRWADERTEAVKKVRARLEALSRAIEGRDAARRHRDACEGTCSHAEEQLRAAIQAEAAEIARWREAVEFWRGEACELGPFLDTLEEPTTAPMSVADARSRAREPLLGASSRLEQRHSDLRIELDARIAERDGWLAGRDPVPDPPPYRRDRSVLPGAPLWRLVQFRESVDERERGSVEAALGDARLLDAWVTPDGVLRLAEGEADILLDPARATTAPMKGRTLASVLELDPAGDGAGGASLAGLLSSIPLVERDAGEATLTKAGVVIGADGTWRIPGLVGRAPLGPAQFIGASSRAAARQARIRTLQQQIIELEREQRSLQDEREKLALRLGRCDEEARSFPSARKIDEARVDVERCRAREETTRKSLVEANLRLSEANVRVSDEDRKLHSVASGHMLPVQSAALDTIDMQLGKILDRTSAFETLHKRALTAAEWAERARENAAEAAEDADTAEDRARVRTEELEEAASRLAAVQDAIGTDYAHVLEEVEAVKSRRTSIAKERKRLGNDQLEAAAAAADANARREQAESQRQEVETKRTRATESFILLCRDGLLADAGVDTPPPDSLTSATAVLEAARRVRSSGTLPGTPDDAALVKLNNSVMARVADASRQLAGRADLTLDTAERGWSVLRARREGLVSSVQELLSTLYEDVQAARAELTKKQQELFEQILSGSVREHLKDRLWAAQELVDRISALLGQVRTESGGVRVGLDWEIDPELPQAAELRRAKDLLLHDTPVAEGRADLDAFLRGRIEEIRAAENNTGEWRDRLARVLDYRQWHRFRVMVHHNRFGDKPRALDSRKVSLSAGEKTIVMILPLLAAVTAHYEPPPGEPPCCSPRLLLMDELYPKLDPVNKRKLMGLLPKLDLDAVFTSDKDRCDYDTLDGIAIHVFQKLGDDETTTTRLVWNGIEMRVSAPDGGYERDEDDSSEARTLSLVED